MLHLGTPERPMLALAPMEGISDPIVRDLLSELGGMDVCVTEFIRVVQRPVTKGVFLRDCPELNTGGRTASGTPVLVQLLGGSPELVAESAYIACELGALGIDLNFGCPARRVNGHDGGASLLKAPERMVAVISATKKAVPAHVHVSAKIRLGWDDPNEVVPLAEAAEAGGAEWVTIHGRTKVQMYKPYADWPAIRKAADAVSIPVVANGDIFTPEAFRRCRDITGSTAFMLGRGAFRTPNLFRWIRGLDAAPWPAPRVLKLMLRFTEAVLKDRRFKTPERAALGRLKGWLRSSAEFYPDIVPVFDRVKRLQDLPMAEAMVQAASTEMESTSVAPPYSVAASA